MKVLIVDDSAPMRERLVELLSPIDGIEVVGLAQDVPEAFDRIRLLRPDVVVLDIQMPGGSGIDVLREVKRSDRDTRVIVLTNYPYAQYEKRCFELGADHFFSKSVGPERLVEALRTAGRSET